LSRHARSAIPLWCLYDWLVRRLRDPWLENTWKTNLIVGVVLGIVVATVTHFYDRRSWVAEYLLAGPLFVALSMLAGWASRRRAGRTNVMQ
jgi:drug/metabolite transporter (DMT)-like permease